MTTPRSAVPHVDTDARDAARAVLDELNGHVVMGLPLGLGKPVHFANALYQLAIEDPRVHLEIFTALTLQPPLRGRGLAGKFIGPLLDRLFDGVPTLNYERDRRRGCLPPNVRVSEFYFAPGSQLGVGDAQREYVSANYTHVVRDLLARGINLLATLVAVDESGPETRYSLSCNPDLTLDLASARATGRELLVVGQVNQALPFMPNDAETGAAFFDYLLRDPGLEHPLFPVLNRPVSLGDYATGLHVSSLVPDGGTLQIGIGALGDAVVNALVQRQHHTTSYQALLDQLIDTGRLALRSRVPVERRGFDRGLYGASEMLVHSFAGLRDAGILKRTVYPHEGIQRAVNANADDDRISIDLLQAMIAVQAISTPLAADDVGLLQRFAGLDRQAQWSAGEIILGDGSILPTDLSDQDGLAAWYNALGGPDGRRLTGGYYLEAGFFLGPNGLYRWLRRLSDVDRAGINMTGVSTVNQLYGNEPLRRLQRRKARFINEAMMVTLSGAVVSDALADAQVISGVGGQYNFVAMAHELDDARAIIMLPATRQSGGVTRSNIVWNYPHTTIPRHLRDIVVTEYGAADLRGLSDRDVIVALLGIADSRFQPELLLAAKAAGKLEADYEIPRALRDNTAERIEQALLQTGEASWFPWFPWGSDMTDAEAALAPALAYLKQHTGDWKTTASLLFRKPSKNAQQQYAEELSRMDLVRPVGLKARMMQRLLLVALDATGQYGRPLKPLSLKYGDSPPG